MKLTRTTLALLLLTLSACGGGQQDNADTNQALLSELKALRQEVQSLSDDVSSIKNRPAAPAQHQAARPTSTHVPVTTAGYPGLGDINAPVTLVEFSDYQCPFCARHTRETLPQLAKNYIDNGKLRYVFMDNPIPSHRMAAKAAEAAHCAGEQGKYWEMHRAMFGNQLQIGLGKFDQFAQQINLDTTTFSQCIKTGRQIPKVEASKRLAAQVGARATPTFVIGKTQPNGVVSGDLIVGAKRYNSFAAAIDRLLN